MLLPPLRLDAIFSRFCFLCSEVLFREMESRQTALRHLIHLLTETREQRLLLELLRSGLAPTRRFWSVRFVYVSFLLLLLLRALGRTEEAAVSR